MPDIIFRPHPLLARPSAEPRTVQQVRVQPRTASSSGSHSTPPQNPHQTDVPRNNVHLLQNRRQSGRSRLRASKSRSTLDSERSLSTRLTKLTVQHQRWVTDMLVVLTMVGWLYLELGMSMSRVKRVSRSGWVYQ